MFLILNACVSVHMCGLLRVWSYSNITFSFCLTVWNWSVRNWPVRKPRCRDTMSWWVSSIVSVRMNALVFFSLVCEDLFWPCLDLCFLFYFQYYEMSYGLNIEMHKQVEKCFFPPSYVKKKNWFKQDCSIEFCSISTVQSAVNMEIINLLPPVLQSYHWKEQTAFSRWQLWSLELKYFRFQNVPPCIAGPLVLYKMLFILNSALINTHVLLFLPPFTGIFTFLRWRDPRFWYYCVSNSWRLSCVSITFDR